MNNGSSGNAPFVPNYTPPCGEECKCGAGWTLVPSFTLTSLALPSETETEIVTLTATEVTVTQTIVTSSTVTRSKWVGTHEEEVELEVTFENGHWVQVWTDVVTDRVRWRTEDVFETWTETEAVDVETEYSVLTMQPTTLTTLTKLWEDTVVSVPGDGEETTVTETVVETDTVVERTKTELTIPFTDGEEEYTSLVTSLVDFCGGYMTAGTKISVSDVDDESMLYIYDAKGVLVHKALVSARYDENRVWHAGEYEWSVPSSGVYSICLQYIKNWGSIANVGVINPRLVGFKTETQIEETFTRAVSVPGDTTVVEVSYTETGTATELVTLLVAVDGEPDGTTLTSTVVGQTVTDFSSVTQVIATLTRTYSDVAEVEKFRYYTKAVTYMGTRLVSDLTSVWRTFVDRTVATGLEVVDDYVIETWYEEVETEVAWKQLKVVSETATATVAATEWSETLVGVTRLEFVPPRCTETTLTETEFEGETTLTETVIGHKCRGAIYYGADTQEMDGIDFRGESVAMVRNGSGTHRKIF